MTVKELIEKLKELPQDMDVVVACQESYWEDYTISSITRRRKWLGQGNGESTVWVVAFND